MSRLSKIAFVVWLCVCWGLFVWGGYGLLTHCYQDYCSQLPFGVDIREEEENPTVGQDLGVLGIEAFGLPTIIFAIASGAYLSAYAVHRRLNSN
jgi:hypothetical protein